MHLKNLHLLGFKTFADRTEVDFSGGITAVVGPNGCGKSNIADALLWVMGEQNPRMLRGAEGKDVIFSGTDKRKKTGMAEVRLTIDNSDRTLPIEFTEVSITRRLYRSGESQYLLNGAPCRLKDIVELFLDTGVGRGAYSFVSQSEIDAVLSARPEDRRELFEEAAGIKKYRVKKREAVRRLDSADQNLTRIRDIVHELVQQRAPLESQAVQARRHAELTGRLQQIEVDLLVGDAQQADYELYAERGSREADENAIRSLDAQLVNFEAESASIGVDLAEAERELDTARLTYQAALSAVERSESQLQIVREREAASEKTAEGLDVEIRELAVRMADLVQQIETLRKRLEKCDSEDASIRDRLTVMRAQITDVETQYSAAARLAEDRQGALMRIAEDRARREAILAAASDRKADTEARLDAEEAVREEMRSNLNTSSMRRSELVAQSELAAQRLTDVRSRRDSIELERRRAVQAEAEAASQLEVGRREVAAQRSRLAALEEMQESGEGFYQGVRAVMGASRKGALRGTYVPVVDILTVPEDLRIAIEVALGGSAQDIVCETEVEASTAIEWLKRERAGRATFLALPLIRPGTPVSSSTIGDVDGIVGVAASLVTAETKYRGVLGLLLGRVLLADSMDAAVRASRRLAAGWSRIVTREGEVLTPGGALTGGSLGGRGAHLVGRKGEIDDLRVSIDTGSQRTRMLDSRLSSSREEREKTELSLDSAIRDSAEAQVAVAAGERELAAADQEVQRLTDALKKQEVECSGLRDSMAGLAAEILGAEKAIEFGLIEDSNADEEIETAIDKTRVLAEQKEAYRTELVRCEVDSARALEKRDSLQREHRSLEEAVELARRNHAAKLAHREAAGSQFADAHLAQREIEMRLAAAKEHHTQSEAHVEKWRSLRQRRLNDSFEKSNTIKECVKERSERQQSLHGSELKIARMEIQLSQTVQRLLDEYGITLQEAIARPAITEAPRETVNEVARLRREIRQMGTVNTGAAEEYARLSERHEFLVTQQADLERARLSILGTIAEIDESTRGTFLETFNSVSDQFALLFGKLFGGGTTRLVLTQPDDLLETGIEVIAQPPGKKPQHLSLLSGGERALTAVALLFSFLAVRPSPFVLLDEVDAPLDGANVERFVRLVQDFTADTQFLIITHNPTTMEAAPRWYGVTMREPGVSSILSYRVPQESIESEPDTAVVLAGA